MDFARKILSNYGWKEGDGLGKNKDGIAKPLKATLKFDNAGFGADQAAADFNNHWWERVFNEAATNVNIKQEGEQIKMVLKDDEDGVEISTKCYSMKKLKKLKDIRDDTEKKTNYKNFLQAATLTNMGDEVENPDKIDTNDIEVFKVKVLTDEELFKACGGRTAHKGARHGLKLSGKLLRIEQQEAKLLVKMMAKRNGSSEISQSTNKLETKRPITEDTLEQECTGKKKKNKNKVKDEDQEVCGMVNVESDKGHKKKRKYSRVECAKEVDVQNEGIPNVKCKNRKKASGEETEKTAQEFVQNVKKKVNRECNDDEIKSITKKKNKDKTEDEIVLKKKKNKQKCIK